MKRMRRLLLIGYLIAILWQLIPAQVYAEEALSKPITAWPLIYHKADQDQAETDGLYCAMRGRRAGPGMPFVLSSSLQRAIPIEIIGRQASSGLLAPIIIRVLSFPSMSFLSTGMEGHTGLITTYYFLYTGMGRVRATPTFTSGLCSG